MITLQSHVWLEICIQMLNMCDPHWAESGAYLHVVKEQSSWWLPVSTDSDKLVGFDLMPGHHSCSSVQGASLKSTDLWIYNQRSLHHSPFRLMEQTADLYSYLHYTISALWSHLRCKTFTVFTHASTWAHVLLYRGNYLELGNSRMPPNGTVLHFKKRTN